MGFKNVFKSFSLLIKVLNKYFLLSTIGSRFTFSELAHAFI